MAESAGTLVSAAVATLAVTIIAREPLGAGFVQQFIVYGGSVALAETAATMVMPRLQRMLEKGSSTTTENIVIRAGAVFGITYGLFMLAGTPSLVFAGGAAIGTVAGSIAHDSILAKKFQE